MTSREDRFRHIFARNHSAVSAYVRRRTKSPADAEDVVADVFTVAWRRLDDVPADAARETLWLYGVARRTLANQRRGAERATRLAARAAEQTGFAPAADAGLAEAGDLRDAMQALSALGEPDQELLRLTLWEGLSHAQVAVVVGTSVPNVAVRMHRAKRRLRAEFNRLEQGAADVGHLTVTRAITSPDPEAGP